MERAQTRPSATDTVEDLRRLATEDDGLFFVADVGGRIVGTIIGGWDGWRGNLYRLAVLPQYRRQGIATALVREAESRLVAKGARRISVLVAQQGTDAVAFWDSLVQRGYKRDPRMVRYVR